MTEDYVLSNEETNEIVALLSEKKSVYHYPSPCWKYLTCDEVKRVADLVKKGEQVYSCPFLVENSYAVDRDRVKLKRVGLMRIPVYYTPGSYHQCDEAIKMLNKASHLLRKFRCIVPGVRSPLVLCSDKNRCSACPFPEYRHKLTITPLSLQTDFFEDEDTEFELCDKSTNVSLTVEKKMQISALKKALDSIDPSLFPVFYLSTGLCYTMPEVSDILNIPVEVCYRKRARAIKLAKKILSDTANW